VKKLASLLLVASVAMPAMAQDTPKAPTAKLAGDWDISFNSPQGAATWRFKFEQSADTLWGTTNTGDFGTLNVTDGWVSGNDISFSVPLNFSGQQILLNFTGTVKSDTINGQIDVPGAGIQPFAFQGIKASGSTMLAPTAFAPGDRPRLVRQRR
jgi:hypothetical protein